MILSFVSILILVFILGFSIREDYKRSKFRNNLKPGQNVLHRFVEDYSPAVIDRVVRTNVVDFHLLVNPRQTLRANVTMIYPV